MKRQTLFFLICVFIVLGAGCSPEPGPARFVNTFIGTGGHGHTYPGAVMPFGMVQLSPDTRLEGWDACSGYHYSDNVIRGFTHTHLNGTGVQDYLDILITAATGSVNLHPGSPEHPKSGYMSRFDHADEASEPGYYRVLLKDYGVLAEMTATPRVGAHQYTFPAHHSSNIIMDLLHGDRVLDSFISFENDREIQGFRQSESWAPDHRIYFVARFSRPFDSYGVEADNQRRDGVPLREIVRGKSLKAYVSYRTYAQEVINVKVGISAVGLDGARKNLETEAAEKTFNQIRNEALTAWNQSLGKIRVNGGSPAQTRVFYSALYHCLINPNIYSDVDGRYRGRDMKIHTAKDFDYYTVFSLWDTFRAFHPLMTIIEPERTNHFIRTFLRQHQEGGLLPVWELASNETYCMIGNHALPVIADAFMKNIRGYDAEAALGAMRDSAAANHFGLDSYRKYGYLRGEDASDSVSKTVEYAYDDWCIAQVAKAMNKLDIYAEYIQRAQYYKNLFDPGSGLMRAKVRGCWFEPFDPREVNFNYTEANAWQYSFFAPHDINGLAELMGGREAMLAKLDALFNSDSRVTGRVQPDISGMIGQYAHGNEPSHHTAYLYNYLGAPWKTQERVRQIMDTLYSDKPDGLCGNEDCGQMSAWYVLSALGFYPVTPGSDIYAIGTPIFPEAEIQVGERKIFTIRAANISSTHFYIQSARLNGRPWTRSWIRHQDIAAGGTLEFVMGPQPNRLWGAAGENVPVSGITDNPIVIIPYVASGSRTFRESTDVSLASVQNGGSIYYTLDGSEPSPQSKLYEQPIRLTKSTVLKAACWKDERRSHTLVAYFDRTPVNRVIRLNTAYAGQYSAGGDYALIDGLRGAADFRTGTWQGYEGVDLDAVVDLGKTETISRIAAGFLQDNNSWIFFPRQVEFYWSRDGKDFVSAATLNNTCSQLQEGALIQEFTAAFKPVKARYVQVVARNVKICPSWHRGAGSKCWIFADEIRIE